MERHPDVQLLLRQLNNGGEHAFDQLYKLFSPRVFSFALSLLKDRAEAEEIVQEVFLKVWDKRCELSPLGSFESFLFTMSKNTILNIIRKTGYHRIFLEYKRYNPEPPPALDQELSCNELENLYKKAIDKLSPRKREIFVLNQTHALSYPEIAQKLGISTKTVRNQMDAASTEIKHFISRLGFTGMLILILFIK
jgi:RNA polymerase sigma-70 factor (ECF subfamily)